MTKKGKPCAIPGCPALRAKNAYVCVAHKKIRTMERKQKYSAVRTTVDNQTFASKAEATHYAELKLRQKAGEVWFLRLQTRWPLLVNGVEIGVYVSDFDYLTPVSANKGEMTMVIVDVKGMKTPLYRWKKKHFEAQDGHVVTEVK